MSDNKKYYYLKLKENFFDSEEMIILENMPDGYQYSNILLKLYLRSLKDEGKLMFKDRIPYNATVLSQIVRHPVGVVEKALNIFKDLGLIEVLDNGAIFMLDIQNYIGESSTEADRKRLFRAKIEEQRLITSGQMSGQMSDKSTPEIELEIEIEKEIEYKKKSPQKTKYAEFVYMTAEEYQNLISDHGEEDTKQMITILDNYKGSSGKKYKSDYRAILNWVVKRLHEDKKKPNLSKNNKFHNFTQEKTDYDELMKQVTRKRIAEIKEGA